MSPVSDLTCFIGVGVDGKRYVDRTSMLISDECLEL